MKRYLPAFLFLVAPLILANEVLAREWRGIVPLHSTRSDVVRLFSACSDANDSCRFEVGNEEVYILFSSELISEDAECAKKLTKDTVMLVEVELSTPVGFNSLGIKKGNFTTFDPSSPSDIGYKGYIDKKEGIVIKTYKGDVLQIDYIAAARDVRLCPSFYQDPESFIQVFYCMLPPVASIDCPTKDPVDGEQIELSANASTGEQEVLFTWSITAGKIVAEKGRSITVDTTGVGGKLIVATVEIDDGNNHKAATSCTVTVLRKQNN